ncbi:MAG: MBL fold metallo-hydrolase [Myxococcales bacterium]|nr:MAG: MBL fold metallo-hydrolase [Myxococcales bacterium]
MKITVLVENSPGAKIELEPEFGLSLLIETGERRILLDTGASGRFAINAEKMGLDLETVDWLVLSHGHYDHGGGLEAFFLRNQKAKAIFRRGAERPFFGSLMPSMPDWLHRAGLLTRYIGLDARILSRFSDRIRWIETDVELAPGLRVLTAIPRLHALAKGNHYLLIRRDNRFLPDDFSHELLLVVEEKGEAVVFSGCAHNGILNMLEAVRQNEPWRPIRSAIGGFHLNLPRSEKMSASAREIRELARELGQRVTGEIHTGHCTGAEAFLIMKKELGERLQAMHTGIQFEA